MNIKVNGKAETLDGAISIAELLTKNEVKNPDMVSVQVNGEFVDKGDFASKQVNENDEVDFLYFMGGGQ